MCEARLNRPDAALQLCICCLVHFLVLSLIHARIFSAVDVLGLVRPSENHDERQQHVRQHADARRVGQLAQVLEERQGKHGEYPEECDDGVSVHERSGRDARSLS